MLVVLLAVKLLLHLRWPSMARHWQLGTRISAPGSCGTGGETLSSPCVACCSSLGALMRWVRLTTCVDITTWPSDRCA